MSDSEWELLRAEQKRLEDEIRAEVTSAELEPLLAYIQGRSAPDVLEAARERLDIWPLVERRAAEHAKRTRAMLSGPSVSDGVVQFAAASREDAVRALHRELREQCFIDISLDDCRRRFLAAWDSQWPQAAE